MRETPAWSDGRQHLAGLADKCEGDLQQNGLSFGVVLAFRACGRLNMVSPVVRVSASGHILIRMDKRYQATLCSNKGQLGRDTISKVTDSRFKKWVEGALAARGASCSSSRTSSEHGARCGVMLTTQYRMHGAICRWSSGEFYAGKLVADEAVAAHTLAQLSHGACSALLRCLLCVCSALGAGPALA